MESKDLHKHLKMRILSGREFSPDDFSTSRKISEQIFIQTKNYISASTIHRFLSATAIDGFSPFVRNSLVQYIGFLQWEDFLFHVEGLPGDAGD